MSPHEKPKLVAALRDFELDIDPDAEMRSLDLATQQLVVIARALSKQLKLLILDEPTAALTEKETLRLFDRVRRLKDRGVATIFVSHRLGEVFSIADRIVVMRDGRICGDHAASGISRMDVVAEMVGEVRDDLPRRLERNVQAPELEVRELSVFDPVDTGRRRVDDFSLTRSPRRGGWSVWPARRRVRRSCARDLRSVAWSHGAATF